MENKLTLNLTLPSCNAVGFVPLFRGFPWLCLSKTLLVVAVFLSWTSYSLAANTRLDAYTIDVNGVSREYLLYQSPLIREPAKAPLMIVLHGGLGNAQHTSDSIRMNAVSASGGFLVAYPEGTRGPRLMRKFKTWNAGGCCAWAVKKKIDDVKFISRLIDKLVAEKNVDPEKIYVAGMSNGAMMAYRLACEIPDKIKAIIPISGTLAVNSCDASRNVAVFHVHGENDENVPVGGGLGSKSVAGYKHRSVADTLDIIAKNRNCDIAKRKNSAGDLITAYKDCKQGAKITYVLFKGGEHKWTDDPNCRVNVKDNCRFISREAWRFVNSLSE